ncbi:hypothetical protein SAY86_016286 [Trapa natans]|uniref:Mitochondrial carrier protein n=1 Tax=Trapa natans TaxID=22666 RepID=A0AAN7LCW2_TRANT|nr:hypothetical protein SAY86_016286 [Trapa natans]
MKEESENGWENCILRDKLVELESVKLHPYGTMQAHEIYNETGITGFWKGIIPTLIMLYCSNEEPLQVCNPSIQFMIYETSLKHLKAKRAAKKDGSKDVTAIEPKKPLK